MDPVLIEVPERIETERLILRCPRPGDGPTVNEAERETRAELKPWMPWAHVEKSLDDSEGIAAWAHGDYFAQVFLDFRATGPVRIGPVGRWPQSLRTAVDMVLAMPGPATVLWGPAHVQIYKDERRSYRDLPIRLGEMGCCHRNEPHGALHGLMRVRQFTQDDAHIFCMEDQIEAIL